MASGKKRINTTTNMSRTMADIQPEIANMMMDARYLRQSSALINDGLQKGFDVLQLANGDIVMTGTKTVVYQYTWDAEKGKLVKTRVEGQKKSRRPQVQMDEDEDTDNEIDIDALETEDA